EARNTALIFMASSQALAECRLSWPRPSGDESRESRSTPLRGPADGPVTLGPVDVVTVRSDAADANESSQEGRCRGPPCVIRLIDRRRARRPEVDRARVGSHARGRDPNGTGGEARVRRGAGGLRAAVEVVRLHPPEVRAVPFESRYAGDGRRRHESWRDGP